MSQEDLNDLKKAFERLAQAEPLTVVLEADAAFFLLAQLQIALRHPANRGPTAEVIRKFAVGLQERIAQRIPDLVEIIEKGWHPEFDQAPTDKTAKRITYQHLALDIQEEVLANTIAFQLACAALANMSGYKMEAIVKQFAEEANKQVDAIPELAVIESIKNLDKFRENSTNA